jgi:hypothetical protein
MFPYLIRILVHTVVTEMSQGTKSGNNWVEVLKVAIPALGPIIAAIIAGIAGAWITHRYAVKREEAESKAIDERHKKDIEALDKRHDLDKESEWRSHAVELTKLEIQRKLEIWKLTEEDKRSKLRPAILDFLANYRDLIELDKITPRDLYLKILSVRISQLTSDDRETLTEAEAQTVEAKQSGQASAEPGTAVASKAKAEPSEMIQPASTDTPQPPPEVKQDAEKP